MPQTASLSELTVSISVLAQMERYLSSNDNKARKAIIEYIAKPPISLKKVNYDEFHGKVLYKTPKYNDYFKENFKFFDVCTVIAKVTQHIPPKGKQYIRRYGLYSSRSRGIWENLGFCCRLPPEGWKEKHLDNSFTEEVVTEKEYESSFDGRVMFFGGTVCKNH